MASNVLRVGALLVLLALAACGSTGTVSSRPGLPPVQGAPPCASSQLRSLALQPLTTPTASPLPPTPTFGPGQPLPLGDLHMLTATTGWATTAERVFWTRDGGTHWKDITPACLQNGGGYLQADFLNGSVGWVWAFQSEASETTSLFSTTNGGQTWQRGTSFHSSYVARTFPTPHDGWALVARPGSQDGTAIDLWRTRDGGATWAIVSSTGTAAHPGSIPSAGIKGGVSFLTSSTGWLGGNAFPAAALPVTHDGGVTWQQQPLPFQLDAKEYQFDIRPPAFFNEQDGLLEVTVLTQSREVLYQLLYLTHDGGATWQSTPPFPYLHPLYDFSDAQHGWMLDTHLANGGTALETTFSATSDGGQHWSPLPGGAALKDVFLLDFLTSTLGWVLKSAGYGHTIMLKTSDGGQTWTQVTPVLL